MLCPKCRSDRYVDVQDLIKIELGWTSKVHCSSCDIDFISKGAEYQKREKKLLQKEKVKKTMLEEKFASLNARLVEIYQSSDNHIERDHTEEMAARVDSRISKQQLELF